LRARTLALAASASLLAACAAVLGLDDITNDPPPGADSGTDAPIDSGNDVAVQDSGNDGNTVVDAGIPPPSCLGLDGGCGADASTSCCATLEVTGGTFNRSNDAGAPATVSAFYLDKYEVTVGRFRKFFDAYPANKPGADAGARGNVAGSGWNPADDALLPADKTAFTTALGCGPDKTWTDTPGANETKPINCVDFYVAFAFCVWDGGRLPTEAEWNYAAAGGDQQRTYAWVGTTFDTSHAYYSDAGGPTFVGSTSPAGDGRFGQNDLIGNVNEWVLDRQNPTYLVPCSDCSDLDGGTNRGRRGGGWRPFGANPPEMFLNTYMRFNVVVPTDHREDIGIRCARAK